MQDTVDQAPSACPRTLASIIKDARRAVCGHRRAGIPAWACSFSGAGPDRLHLERPSSMYSTGAGSAGRDACRHRRCHAYARSLTWSPAIRAARPSPCGPVGTVTRGSNCVNGKPVSPGPVKPARTGTRTARSDVPPRWPLAHRALRSI